MNKPKVISGNKKRPDEKEKYSLEPVLKKLTLEDTNISIWHESNDLDGDIPLFVSVEVGSIDVDCDGKDYKLYFNHAFLQLNLSGFDVIPKYEKYTKQFDKKIFDESFQHKKGENSNVKSEGSAGAKIGTDHLGLFGKVLGSNNKKSSSSEILNIHKPFRLVEVLPNLGWRIGDEERGDPRKNFGYIEGRYFYHDDKEHKSLCYVKLNEFSENSRITAQLSISLKSRSTHIIKSGDYISDEGVEGDELVKVSEAFKDRLRSIALLKENFHRQDKFVISKDKLVVQYNKGVE